MSQTERILYIDRTLRTKRPLTTQQVADYFEVSTRQVKRDIEYLRDRFNAPIIFDRFDKVYRYETDFDQLAFADQNLVLFYVVLKSLVENQHYIPVVSNDIVSTVSKDVPESYKHICDNISFELPKFDTIDPEVFLAVCEALRSHQPLDICYTSAKGESSERTIEPEHITNYEGAWYLIAYDWARSDIRTFHLSRISKISLSSEKVQNHDENYKKRLESFISENYGIFKGDKKILVKIRFWGMAKTIVSSQVWHKDQILEPATEGDLEAIELSLPVASFNEILGKILSFGSEAKPLEPVELVTQWKETVTNMQKNL